MNWRRGTLRPKGLAGTPHNTAVSPAGDVLSNGEGWSHGAEGEERAVAPAAAQTPRGGTFLADNVSAPATLDTSRGRHREVPLCTPDLTAALLSLVQAMPARDRRHEQAVAYPEILDWLDYLELDGKSARTVYAYERMTAPLLRQNPDLTLAEITHVHVNAALAKVPPRSRYISRSVYAVLFQWAEADERIDRTPVRAPKVPRMRAGNRRHKNTFTGAGRALLQQLPSPDGPLFAILFGTGIRRAEARHLRRAHIDLGRMRLVVYSGKGDKDRVVPFTPEVAAAVADLDLLERLEPQEHLWYRRRYPPGDRRRRGDPIGDTTFETWYRDMLQQAGVPYLNPHQTRHTYGHWLRDQGLDLEERQKSMGHESSNTTEHYYGRVTELDVARKTALL